MYRKDRHAIRFVSYNNKSRKGEYIIIHDKQKKKRHIYRQRDNVPIDAYILGKHKKWKEAPKRYIRDLTKKQRLSDTFKSGNTHVQLRLIEMGNPVILREAYKRLFGPLVLDKDLLDIVIDNRDKLRHRYSYDITIKGEHNSSPDVLLGGMKIIGQHTPEELFARLYGQQNYKTGRYLRQGDILRTSQELHGVKNGAFQYTSDGFIQQVIVMIQFQKG